MSVRNDTRVSALLPGLVSLCLICLLGGCSRLSLLDPAGPIGASEKSVILIALGLMMIVVIPVFVMTFLFAWRYRASNGKAAYAPKWSESRKIETVVWLIPALIVCALGYVTWTTTHALSPYRPLASKTKPLRVDAVSMNWKWLFIYPDLHIATVNRLVIPTNVPINFRLTSDTVMTSFFIPRLGTQIYAMPGMQTRLHLLADRAGTFAGRNFQFSGRGYASMHFDTVATSMEKFRQWVDEVRHSGQKLDDSALSSLEKPSIGMRVVYYAPVRPHLFDHIIQQFRMTKPATPQPPAANGA